MMAGNLAVLHGRSSLSRLVQKCPFRSLTTERTNAPSPYLKDQSLSQPLSSTINKNPTSDNSPETENPNIGLNIVNQWIPEHMKKKGPSDYVVLKTTAMATTIKRTTAKLGAVTGPRYHPRETLWNPPRPEEITLEMLMAAQTHFGHHTSLWNPMNQRYIYGVRNGIHIISLETTAAHLRRAAKVVEDVCYRGGIVLFVGSKKGQASAVVKAAELAKSYHLFERWQPGTITNGDQILKACKIKAVDPLDNDIEGFEDRLEDWSALKPDLVVCLNPMENYVLLYECGSNNIPTIGVIDTNADPTWVTYTIPANDDSLRTSNLIAGVLGRAGESGQKRRLADAAAGKVTWNSSPRLRSPMEKEEVVKENT